jgi:hypothetical protein
VIVRALHQLLLRVLLAAAPHLDLSAIEEIIAIRVSDESLKKLAAHVGEGLRIYWQHAIVGPWMRSLPVGLFDHPDDAERARHGIHRVELGHVHDGIGRTKRIGYVALAHHEGRAALLLFVHHSASEADVQTSHGPKNSWAELIVGSWEWATQCRILRFSHDDRMNRSTAVWVRINDAVKARPGGKYCLADIEVDPHRDGWQGIILGQKSSEEVEVGKVRRLAGRLTKLASGAWPRGQVPVGLRLGRIEDVRGELRPDKRAGLEIDPGQAAELTAVLQQYAAGVSKARIAAVQARKAARDGKGALLLPRVVPLLDDATRQEVRATLPVLINAGTITTKERDRVEEALEEPTNPGRRETATMAGVAYVDRILAARQHLRTGLLRVLTFGAVAGRTEYHGWRPTFVTATASNRPFSQTIAEAELDADHPYWDLEETRQNTAHTHGFWFTPLQLGTVVELPGATWEAIEKRIRNARDDMERRRASGQRRPLGGLRWQTDSGRFQLGQGGERETYRISGPDGAHLHTVDATHTARALGELLLQLVERVDAAPLPLLQPAEDSPQTRTGIIHQRIRELEAELSDVEAKIGGLMRDRATMDPTSRQHRLAGTQIDDLGARADKLEEQQIPALRAKLERSATKADEPALEETDADFAHLAVTASALLRCNPVGPAAVHDAVSWLLDHGRGLSNLRTGEHDRQVLIDVAVKVPLVDGTVGWIDAGTLDLTDRRLTSTRKAETIDDVARRLLRDGEPLDALTARYGWSAAELLVDTASWLSEHTELNMYLRAAVVTAAAAGGKLPVGAVVHAHATGNNDALQEVNTTAGLWVVKQIEQAYLGPEATWAKNSGWVRNSLAVSRRAMALIAQNGRARRQTVIESVEGLRNDEQLKDVLHPGRRSFWQPPLRLHDGWIDAHVCRAVECPGGGAAPMTGFLPVPELVISGDAVYCRYCWRTLSSQQVLPEAYRPLWDVGTDTSALERADGVPFVADPPTAPTRGISLLRTRDVAEALGLPQHRVNRLVEDGQIPATRNAGGKLVYDADRALSPSIRRRFATSGGPIDTTGDKQLNLQRAAELLGTSPMIVRMLSRTGAITNVGGTGAALYDRDDLDGLLADIRHQCGRPTATMAELATQSELAAAWDVTTTKLRRLVARGVLDGVTVGTVLMVDRVSIERLDERQRRSLDPSVRTTTQEVAARAGLHGGTVLHHHASGALRGVQLTPDGAVWFLPEEVDAWLASRGR